MAVYTQTGMQIRNRPAPQFGAEIPMLFVMYAPHLVLDHETLNIPNKVAQ